MPKAATLTIESSDDVDRMCERLGDELAGLGASYEVLVAGGASLVAQGLVRRPTHGIDIVGLREHGQAIHAVPFPGPLSKARCAIARDLRIKRAWLTNNRGWVARRDVDDFVARAVTRSYGQALTVHFASRADEIELKFAAGVGYLPPEHEADLRALKPTEQELFAAARRVLRRDWDSRVRLEVLETLDWLGACPRPEDLETPEPPEHDDWW